MRNSYVSRLVCVGLFVVFCLPFVPTAEAAPADWVPNWEPTPVDNWWITQPEDEVTSPYYDSIPYWEIAPTLHEIELTSDRVEVEVIGQSAGGRDIFLVTVAKPDVLNNLGHYRTLRHFMVDDPEKAQQMLDQFNDFKVPVYIHASMHGPEYTGTDASIELIKTLAYSNDPKVMQILDNVIFLVNPVANPDGRVSGSYGNEDEVDLNGDYISLTQPETLADVRVVRDWMPMVDLDLHGFGDNQMLIEPCTPPHNLNLEYDLYLKWALAQAEVMEAWVYNHTGFPSIIPLRDVRNGWDDWAPIYQAMYSMYHGAYGATIECANPGLAGVNADYYCVWGALNFVVSNRKEMLYDQMEIMKRGVLGLPQQPIPQEILDQTKYDQYQKYVEFPEAYVIPATPSLQENPIDAAYLVDFLIFHGIEVEKSKAPFEISGVSYPSGTYIVRMHQGLRGLANVMLSDGWDITYGYGVGNWGPSWAIWANPLLWGVSRVTVWDSFEASTAPISHADPVVGTVVSGDSAGFAYLPTSNEAIRATNDLLLRGIPLVRTTTEFKDQAMTYGVGTFIIPGTVPGAATYASEIASRYSIIVYSLSKMPGGTQDIRMPKIAVDADQYFLLALRDLGFPYTMVYWPQLNQGVDLSGYDVYIQGWAAWNWSAPRINKVGIATLQKYVKNGGNFIGIARDGVAVGVKAGLADVSYKMADEFLDSGIVRLQYDGNDLVSAQFPANGYGLVYQPVWFTTCGKGVKVTASISTDDFFVAGYWDHRDAAAGQPIIVRQTSGASNVVLMGIDPVAYFEPMVTYKLVANALYLN